MKYKLSTLGAIVFRSLIGSVYPSASRHGSQVLNLAWKNELLDVGSLVKLRLRDGISHNSFITEIGKKGLSEEKGNQMLAISKRLLSVNELVNLRRREEIGKEEYQKSALKQGIGLKSSEKIYKLSEQRLPADAVLKGIWREIPFKEGRKDYISELEDQGWSKDRIEALEKTSMYFPPPPDLIMFAVREVYTPEIVSEYKMLEGLPEKFIEEAKKGGIPKQQAINYWLSHWILPSVSSGYEMLHRGVISEEELKTLMRTQDIMPYWRDKLMSISYNPFTRVDVRRMNKMGILDESGVKKSYLDLGYNEEKAEQMTQFTILYNEEPPDNEKTDADRRKEELRGLTRSAILKQYKEQALDSNTASTYLSGLGYTPEVVDFYLSKEEYSREEEKMDGYIKAYHRLYVNGIINHDTLISALGKMNLPSTNVEYLINLWDMEMLTKPSQPSKADIVRFAKKGIITLDRFKEMMSSLGYSLEYIKYYLEDYNLAKD